MPNWCEGTLKIRGKVPQIVKLLTERFEGAEVTVDDGTIEVVTSDWSWVKDSRRAFTLEGDVGYSFETDKPTTVAIPICQAWCFDVDYWVELSASYDVDIRIHGFEAGMGFESELEVHKGKIVANETITYKDYIWECPMPLIGG